MTLSDYKNMKDLVEIHFKIQDKILKKRKQKGSVLYELHLVVPVDTFPYILLECADICKKFDKS